MKKGFTGIGFALALAALTAGGEAFASVAAIAADEEAKSPAPAGPAAPAMAPVDAAARPAPPQPGHPPETRPDRAEPLDLKTIAAKVARHPGEPYLLNEYGNQLIRMGRVNEARDMYERALKLDRGFAIGWNNLGVAHSALGNVAKAVQAYRRAIKIAPGYAWAHYNLGAAYDAGGRYAKAIRSYENAYTLDPDLLKVEKNPQVATNRHLAAVLASWYINRGGSVQLPVQSAYPDR